jgi:hypothetical protein
VGECSEIEVNSKQLLWFSLLFNILTMRELLRGILAVTEYHKVILQNLQYTNHEVLPKFNVKFDYKFETISTQKN